MNDLTDLIAVLARAIVDKGSNEQRRQPIVTATALSIDTTVDAFPHVRCHVDGNPADQVDFVPIAAGSGWAQGQRIIVIYTAPAGAWAVGPTLGSNVAYYCDVAEGTDSPQACVTFTLDTEQTIGVDIAVGPGTLDHWTIDDQTVGTPTSDTHVTTMVRLEAGEHTICAACIDSKDNQLVMLKISTGGINTDDVGCVEFAEDVFSYFVAAPAVTQTIDTSFGDSAHYVVPAGGPRTLDTFTLTGSGDSTALEVDLKVNGSIVSTLTGAGSNSGLGITLADADEVWFSPPGGQDPGASLGSNGDGQAIFNIINSPTDEGNQSIVWTP